MRNVMTMKVAAAACVTVLGALLAAGPAADENERVIAVTLPSGPGGPDAAAVQFQMAAYQPLISAIGVENPTLVVREAIDRLPKGDGSGPVVLPRATLSASDARAGAGTGRIEVRLRLEPAANGNPIPAGLADAMVGVIRDRVARRWDAMVADQRAALPVQKRVAAEAADRLAKARGRVAAAEAKLREETGLINLSAAGMQAAEDALELEREKIELDLAGLKARQAALQDAIAQQTKKAVAAQNDDVALRALAKAVEAAKARVEIVRQQSQAALATPADVSAAESAELEAEARLAERRGAIGGSAEAMAQWNRELTNATIGQREQEARLAAATKRLSALADAAQQRKELGVAREAEASAQQDAERADGWLRNVTEWLEHYGEGRPRVEVRGGPATTAPAR